MSKERIHQLLAAVGSRPQTDESTIESMDYNWHEPHYFSSDQLKKLDEFGQKIAVALSKRLTELCASQFEVEVASISQHYVGEFSNTDEENERKDYYLAFGSDPNIQFGLLAIPEQTAIFMAKQLLGDSESNEESDRELSQLEESLLYDLGAALIKVISNAHENFNFNPSGSIVCGQWPLELNESEEICRFSFSVKKTGTKINSNASFFFPCSKMEAVAGINIYSHDDSSVKDFSNIIIEHLGSTPVSITVQLANSQLNFEEMMNLQVDDIVILDKRIDEPVELIVEGQTVGYGWPAKSEGNYAVSIAATEF